MSYQKRLNDAALIIASTWDTEADANAATMRLAPDNPGVPKLVYPPIPSDEVYGPNNSDVDHANFGVHDFSLDFSKVRYDGNELKLLAAVFGADAVEPLFVVTTSNNKIDFTESAGALVAAVAAGSYTGTTLATAIAAALNGTATKVGTYTCTWSASTLKFTIAETAGPTNFTLMWNTGTNKATDISTLCGFSDAADDTGAATYTSDSACVGSGAFQHTLSLSDDVDGIFFSYAVAKGTKIHVVPSLKAMKSAFTVNAGMLKGSFPVRGTKVIDDSSVITSLSSVTGPANQYKVKYGQGVFRMNAASGSGLAVGDVVKPKNFNLDTERKMAGDHDSGSFTIPEPRQDGKTDVKFIMEFSRIDATNELYLAALVAQTEQKADVTFTGPVIVGTHTYKITWEMPRLHIDDVEYADAGIIPAKVTMSALQASAAPTGMTVTKPLTCTIINTRSTSLLV